MSYKIRPEDGIARLNTLFERLHYHTLFSSRAWMPNFYITDEDYNRMDYPSYMIEIVNKATTRAIDKAMARW